MKQSDLKHLRRLVAWVRCEIGQSPDELVATMRNISHALGHPEVSPEAKQRLVESHDKARQVPKYVRAAVKALDRYARPPGTVVDAEDGAQVATRHAAGEPQLLKEDRALHAYLRRANRPKKGGG